ncbi:hypothetical protein TPHA_0D04250 [Tetrapisispora phaffii CBS 4417]|uniref:Uncharacterized protein n=1 Tax=Tetrapisispora phaffii (strain ATCC 24235 / CBS 4417 / NBRC 1672 / NRRL Y-8282 / UCD 70-5) TaxID=1071381 RepID=G8BRY4_TETPH|nr:hypothetical protein TPHA_0D04250 [Tetrapisispora phaffii CBS 4417]CCE63059.1 hypothetical protein TPHA_0D04250 [Tetrapisispora phaffii CBS 4417]
MSKRKDTFTVLEDHPGQEPQQTFLTRHISRKSENTEYISPFRNPQDTVRSNYAKSLKEKKFPTTSATSNFNKMVPGEMGYSSLAKNDKRAKDIQFPKYLLDNEKRQAQLLMELQIKEHKLHELQKSSRVLVLDEDKNELVLEESSSSDEEEESEEDDDDGDEGEDEDGDESVEEEKYVEEEEDNNAEENISEKIESIIGELDSQNENVSKNAEILEEQSNVVDTEASQHESKGESLDEEEEEEDTEQDAVGPIDPSIVPMVRIPPICTDLLSAPKTNATFSIKSLISGAKGSNKTAKAGASNMTLGVAVPETHAVASPENPEYLVRTNEYNIVSKAVYDQMNYEQKLHSEWLKNFNAAEDEKYNTKKQEYEDKLVELQKQLDDIEEKKKISNMKKQQKIEIMEYQLVKNVLDVQSKYNVDKGKVIKETELMKLQKINAKEDLLAKQLDVKNEIEKLNNEKEAITNEYNIWNGNLENLTTLLDEKIAKIEAINENNMRIQKDIEVLQVKKLNLENEIKDHEEKDKLNKDVLQKLNVEKDYLPRLNEIDEQIAAKFDKLAIIKNETISENNQLSILTKKLEEERIAHENEIKMKNEKMKREQDELLQKKLTELQEKHNEEMAEIQKKYQEK